MSFATAWSLFVDPVTAEKRRLLDERWQNLPPAVKVATQGLGQKATGCGATIGTQPKCDFACTGCYLGTEANRIPALPVEEVLAQIDRIRAWLGPKSNLQLTDGEITLRPPDELVRILSHARKVGAIPMVMTHGDNFRRNPGLLERLMTEGGLTEVSIHVDITQRGRDGYRSPKSEVELMPLRDELADLVRNARKATGLRLRAATTMTITSQNVGQVSDVCRWLIRNRDAFSLISFQPLAQVGRTRSHLEGVSSEQLWAEVGKATAEVGTPIGNAPLHFGHPDCTRFVPMIALEDSKGLKLVELIRDHEKDLEIMKEYTDTGLLGVAFRDDRPEEMVGRALGMMRQAGPFIFGRGRRWVNEKLKESMGTSFAPVLARGLLRKLRVDSVTFTSHHFMDASQLETERGKERLDACVFRVPIDDEMVPMCRVNAGGVREKFYEEITAKAQGHA